MHNARNHQGGPGLKISAAYSTPLYAHPAPDAAAIRAAALEGEIGTLESAVQNMRSADKDERTIEARWSLASKIAGILKRQYAMATKGTT